MALRLILTRHAKSGWGDPLLSDEARPLNARGHADASALGAWLKAQDYTPDQALVSSANRTQETFGLIQGHVKAPDKIDVLETLYLASSDQILKQLRRAQGSTVLLIAHNPGIAEFASRFAKTPAPHADFARYPTSATTVFDVVDEHWADVQFGAHEVIDFCVPKDVPH